MGSQSEPSISQWILGAKQGDSLAIGALWRRYFERLVGLARQKLAETPRRVADEEDVALSAFASFCRAAQEGRFPDLTDRHDLWRLLITLTAHKAVDQMRRERRAKRGGGSVRGGSVLRMQDESGARESLDRVVGKSPTPEFAALVAEQAARLLDCLNDDLRPVALARMQDYTNQETAAKLGCSLTTVERSLRLIRKIWQHEMER